MRFLRCFLLHSESYWIFWAIFAEFVCIIDVKKEILFIIENLRGGGAEKALVDLLQRFDYTRYNVSLCVAHLGGVYQNDIPEEVNIIPLYKENHSLCRKAFRYYKRYGFSYMLKFQLQRRIKLSYDVIVSFLEGRSLLMHNLIKERGKQNITWVHCDLLTYHWTTSAFPNLTAERACYTNMDKVVFVSHEAMKNFSELFQLSVPSICIYNLIDAVRIRKLAAEEEIPHTCITVTSIGTVNRVKAFDRIVRVAKCFQQENGPIRFQIIGEEDDERQLRALCRELGVQDSVSILGFKNNPYPYLKSSDIYVSTSLSEGFSLVICEAMSLGVPIVATHTAGASELLENGEYGVLVEQDDEAIYRGIKRLVDDKQLRRQYAEKAALRSENFNADETMQKIYELFN